MQTTAKNLSPGGYLKKIAKLIALLLAMAVLLVIVFIGFNWAPDRSVNELKARWAAPPSTFIDLGGMKVHIRDEGPKDDAQPILLLHGTSSSLHTWQGWVDILKTERRVISFDLPGFGLTGPSPDNNYTIENYVRFVNELIDKLGINHCVLVGNSFGGYISWATALSRPDRIDKIILIDAGGYTQTSTSIPIGFRIARMPVLNRLMEYVLPRSFVVSSVRNVFGDANKVTPELIDRYYEISLRAGNRRSLVERFKQAPMGIIADQIPKLKLPTFIIWGGKDRLIPTTHAQQFHRDIPGSELIIFEDLGHIPQEEDPQRTVNAVKTFLSLK